MVKLFDKEAEATEDYKYQSLIQIEEYAVEKSKKDPKANGCTTYNTHRASEGCYWEHLHQGEQCAFEHSWSWCKLNRNVVEKHKLIQCEFKPNE